MKKQKGGIAKTVVLRHGSGMYFGYIYLGQEELEKTGGRDGFWLKENAIEYTNQRVDFWRAKKQLDIPYVQ